MKKSCWFLACGTVPPSRMPRLERILAARLAEKREQEPEIPLFTDFYYHYIFPNWPGNQPLSGSMSFPGHLILHAGDEAILFCLVSRKGHRDTLQRLEDHLRKTGCSYSIALF